jgi:recombinational DNA repair ATPase RecF
MVMAEVLQEQLLTWEEVLT